MFASQSSQMRRDLLEGGHGHDPRDDRHLDPGRPRRGDEVEVGAVVEEELGDQEGGAVVHLGLQVGDVGLEARGLRMHLGEAGAADGDLGMGLGDQSGQVGGAAEPVLGLDEVRLAARRVAAQGEHVLDPGLADAVEELPQARLGLADAAEVGHRLDAVAVLDRLGRSRASPRASRPRSIGDREEGGLELAQDLDGLEQGRAALLRLRGEELDREARARPLQDLVDAHDGPW